MDTQDILGRYFNLNKYCCKCYIVTYTGISTRFKTTDFTCLFLLIFRTYTAISLSIKTTHIKATVIGMLALIQTNGHRVDYGGPLIEAVPDSMQARRADIEAVRDDY